MSFDLDMAKTIQRYLAEIENQELTIEEILLRPRWKRVWIWYEGKPKSELTLDEVKAIYGD